MKIVLSDWLRWSSRTFLVAASLSRIGYMAFYFTIIKMVGPKYWEWDKWAFIIPISIITAITWYVPLAGGIAALVWIPVGWFFIFFKSFATTSQIHDTPLVFESIFLGIGGCLAIIYDVWKRKFGKT